MQGRSLLSLHFEFQVSGSNTCTWGYVVWPWRRLRFRVDRRLSRFQESWLVPLLRPKREERGRNLTDGLTELGPADNGSPDRKTIKGDGEREGRRVTPFAPT